MIGPTKTAHFIVALRKILLTVLPIRLVVFCLRASNCIRLRKSYYMILGTYLLYAFPITLKAAEFVPLSPSLPLSNSNNWLGNGMEGFLNLLFAISVAVAAVLAVIMLAIGGFKYMTSESVFNIGGAKEQITNAIVGLLIVLASITILYTINPKLVEINIFKTTSIQLHIC